MNYEPNPQAAGVVLSKLLFVASVLVLVFAAGVVVGPSIYTPKTSLIPTTIPTQPPVLTSEQIKQYIGEAAQLREERKYTEGEAKITQAFNSAVARKDGTLIAEAANNASIQYRLLAGQYNRNKDKEKALEYTQKSLDVYATLKANGWFSENDPVTMRNWAHALLYAGKFDGAGPALDRSITLQTLPAAKGDELCHKAALLVNQGNLPEAKRVLEEGTHFVEENNGSPVWLTFCMMTAASLNAHFKEGDKANQKLVEALHIAQENNLAVREEEITFMLKQELGNMNVLKVVGVL